MEIAEWKIIGIDLGTTYSEVAIVEDSEPGVILNAEGSNKTPSIVAFLDKGEVVVGEIARRQAATNPLRTISSVKRLMGRSFAEVVEAGEKFPFKLVEKDDDILIDIEGMGYRPEQISALILQKLKESAEAYVGEAVKQAIITVPAYFDDLQRVATQEAARLAGLEVLRLINEPTAAAMAYGLGKENEELVAVYDFGGGTFDISILEIDGTTFEVLVSNGDSHLGGDDLDNALVHWLVEDFSQQHGVNLLDDPVALYRLKEVAEKAKCELSTTTQTLISLPFAAYGDKHPLHLEKTIHRRQFEDLIQPYVDKTIACCKTALEEASISKKNITKIILVGGSSRIPLVQEEVEDFFGKTPFKGVNPDEIVALGAATQAGILAGHLEEVVLLDITPHSMGVEVKGAKVSTIIEKNSTIPIKAAKMFTTTEDNQTFVNIHVLQGESDNAPDNRSLGKFTLTDLEPARAGIPRVRIAFFINADGVLEISAADLASGSERSLTVVHSFLTGEEKKRRRHRRKRVVSRRERIASARPGQPAPILAGVQLEKPAEGGEPKDVSSLYSTFQIVKDETQKMSTEKLPITDVYGAATAIEGYIPPETIPSSGQAPPKPSIEPTLYSCVKGFVETNARGDEALEAYNCFCQRTADLINRGVSIPPEMCLILARAHTLCQRPEEARDAIRRYLWQTKPNFSLALATAEFLIQSYPNYILARRDRAHIYGKLNRLKEAISDLEQIQEKEEVEAVTDDLMQLYIEYLRTNRDPVTEFKIVKIYIKKNRLDDAIEILQNLAQMDKYKLRALKILGLTYWQKNMFSLAWHTFKLLPQTPEITDILYRLAADVEKSGDLKNARDIYQKIADEVPDYRDAAAKFKKLDYRMQLHLEETEKTKSIPLFQDSRFTIIEEINRGSMGVIYRARDNALDDIVALKVLNDYLCQDPQAVERFKSEARAAKKLSHPHIVRIHDMFETYNKKFLSMEYIEGTDLKQMLASKIQFTEETIHNYFLQMCDALAYAHSMGVIHRDIKPANIMITPLNSVKITDFGIAKILKKDATTKSGTAIVGTPLYMAPEQITGTGVDARTDIYSLGIMLYELVSGEPPFCEGNIEYHHVNTPPGELKGDVSDELKEIVVKMIQKDPEDRYHSVDKIFADIKAIEKQTQSKKP